MFVRTTIVENAKMNKMTMEIHYMERMLMDILALKKENDARKFENDILQKEVVELQRSVAVLQGRTQRHCERGT